MQRFTIDGSELLEKRLELACEHVLHGVQRIVPARDLEGLVLGGGYGRGEGGVLRTPAGESPYNDLDFYVLVRGHSPLNEWRYRRRLLELGEELSTEAGAHVELKVTSLERLRRSAVTMFSYDLVAAHRVVLGPERLFAECGHLLDAGQLPLSEATRLLFNRCSGLLLAGEFLHRRVPPLASFCRGEQTVDFVVRNLAKAQLAMGDALLTAIGQYHWSCRERARRLEQLAEVPAPMSHSQLETPPNFPVGRGSRRAISIFDARLGRSLALPENELFGGLDEILRHHAEGVEFKLRPCLADTPLEVLAGKLGELSALAQELWLWLESRRLQVPFRSAREYALHGREKCAGSPVWRNVALNLKTFGFKAVFDSLGRRYPRERLFNALALLLWNRQTPEEPNVMHELRRQLGTNCSDRAGLVHAYAEAWPAYG